MLFRFILLDGPPKAGLQLPGSYAQPHERPKSAANASAQEVGFDAEPQDFDFWPDGRQTTHGPERHENAENPAAQRKNNLKPGPGLPADTERRKGAAHKEPAYLRRIAG